MEFDFFPRIGANIAEELEMQGIPQSRLAADLGISNQNLSMILKGMKVLNSQEMDTIAWALGITRDRLLIDREHGRTYLFGPIFLEVLKSESTRAEFTRIKTAIQDIRFLQGVLQGQL